jgi:hypothetical protein
LFDYYRSYNPPANVGRPPPYEEWLQRAIREDQEAAGLLPPEQPYWGPFFMRLALARTGHTGIGRPAAAMVNEFVETTQNTNKTQLLASNQDTFRALVNSENFIPQNGPSTQVIDATSFV